MTKVKVDMTGVEEFTRCEEGKHPMVIKKIEMKKTQSDDDMLAATLEVTVGESKGARVFDNYPLTPKALWKLKQVLNALGGFKTDGKLVLDTDKMLNRTVLVEVIHEEYEGKTRARIQGYFPAGSSIKPTAKPETEEEDEDDWDEA